jgi:hypothetical protein
LTQAPLTGQLTNGRISSECMRECYDILQTDIIYFHLDMTGQRVQGFGSAARVCRYLPIAQNFFLFSAAYFARQFDALRRRCGVSEGFNRSLAESANWLAEGGKSKANFFKTSDDRYIIKSLVNAWNVADLYVRCAQPSYTGSLFMPPS